MWIQYHQKQCICLSTIRPFGYFLHFLCLINSHNEECQNILVICINLTIVLHPALFPAGSFFLSWLQFYHYRRIFKLWRRNHIAVQICLTNCTYNQKRCKRSCQKPRNGSKHSQCDHFAFTLLIPLHLFRIQNLRLLQVRHTVSFIFLTC